MNQRIISRLTCSLLVLAATSAHAQMQCARPTLSTFAFPGGDKTDPVRFGPKNLKHFKGHWSSHLDGSRQIYLTKAKKHANAAGVALTVVEYNKDLRRWQSSTSSQVDFVNGQAVFHFVNSSGSLRDVVLSAYYESKAAKPEVSVSILQCDARLGSSSTGSYELVSGFFERVEN